MADDGDGHVQGVEMRSRRELVVDAALDILAEEGARGLTHREVDRRLGQPLGSTSNYFRRRTDLFGAVARRIMELDIADSEYLVRQLSDREPLTIGQVTDACVDLFWGWFEGVNRNRSIARMEVLFEAFRRPELKVITDESIEQAIVRYEWMFSRLNSESPEISARLFAKLISGLHLMVVTASGQEGRWMIATLLQDFIRASLDASRDIEIKPS